MNVDPQPEGLREVLSRRAHLDVVGVASDPVQGLRQARDLQPDVVLVDTSMGQAVAAVHAILADAPAAKVIALAVSEENQDIFAFAEAGVCGYVTCDAALDHVERPSAAVLTGPR